MSPWSGFQLTPLGIFPSPFLPSKPQAAEWGLPAGLPEVPPHQTSVSGLPPFDSLGPRIPPSPDESVPLLAACLPLRFGHQDGVSFFFPFVFSSFIPPCPHGICPRRTSAPTNSSSAKCPPSPFLNLEARIIDPLTLPTRLSILEP